MIQTIRFCAFTMLIALPMVSPAKLYKWVDDEGNVFYSDKVPPSEAGTERQVINEQGVTVDRIDRAKTPEELKEEERLRKIAEEEERKRKEQQEKDEILLDTFNSTDDIIMTRDGKIQAITAVINVTRGSIDKTEKELMELQGQAADFEKTGKAIPQDLLDKMDKTKQQIAEYETFIQSKKDEQEQIRVDYEYMIERYDYLRKKQLKAKAEAEAKKNE